MNTAIRVITIATMDQRHSVLGDLEWARIQVGSDLVENEGTLYLKLDCRTADASRLDSFLVEHNRSVVARQG